MKKFLSIALAAILVCSCVLPAFADGKIASDEEKEQYTQFFNNSVNAVKTDLPKANVKFNNYVPEGGIKAGGTSTADELDDMAVKYLIPVLEGLFNNRSSVAKSFAKTLFGDQGNTVETLFLHKGALRNNSLPIYGEKYMSSLTPANDFDMAVYENEGDEYPNRIIVSFADMPLSEAKKGSLAKTFSLPSGTLDPTILGGSRTELTSRLDDAELQDFTIKNAQILTRYDSDGALTYYGSVLDYSFAVSFYDSMNLIAAVMGYNFYTAVMNTVNTVLKNIGRDDIPPEELLKTHKIYITYRRVVEIDEIDFRDRLFGDIDDDNSVTASDARAALRHAVGLDLITSSNDQIYSDVNFDGVITAADARSILRMSVGLETTFSSVPEGCAIKIVKIEEEIAPDEEDGETETPNGGNGGGLAGIFDGFDPDVKLEDIAKAVFDAIGVTKDLEGEVQNSIDDWIEAIKKLVEAARK
ncbi:MAG: hypothetical protein J1E34_08230 [Oscillospiraceae bacterium]|nr:hypothetical protein [Oscillospiraceae bacterium]